MLSVPSGEASAAAARPKSVGVVIVHGVGETELGYSVNTLVQALQSNAPGYRVARHSEVIRLADTDDLGRQPDPPQQFRVVRRRASHDSGIDIAFDELHWADLTNLKAGRLNALLGMFRVIFESHHLVNAMLTRAGDGLSGLMRWLLLIAGWLMRGPLAALTIATSAICGVMMFGPVTGMIGELPVASKFLIVQFALLFLAAGLLFMVGYSRDVSWYDTAFWLLIVTVGFIALESTVRLPEAVRTWPVVSETVGYHCYHRKDDQRARSLRAAYRENAAELDSAQADACYINGPYRIIAYGWRFWGGLMVVSILLLLMMHYRAFRTGDKAAIAPAATGIGIVIMQFMLWTLIVVTVIFPMLNRGEAVKDLLQVRQELIANKVDVKRGIIAKLMEVPAIDLDWIGRFKFVYGAAATTLVGFVLIGAVLIARRSIVGYRHRRDLALARERMPALLFNGWLLAWLMFAVLAVILFIWFTETTDHPAFEPVKSVMLMVAAAAALLVPALLLERVSNGVHIARDLIDHHFQPRLETGTYFLPAFFLAKSRFPRRERIKARLEAVIENMLKEGPWERIVLVGHSQGSVVLFDYMQDRHPYVAAMGCEKPAMLTFGAPLQGIYQKYFHEYEGDNGPEALRGRLSRWLNLYRVDDYVGGPIEDLDNPALENVAMRAGGHMDYWREPDVARALDELIRGRASSPRGLPQDAQPQ